MTSNKLKTLQKLRLTIADSVRRLRGSRGWTQKELAENIGISQARLSELEHGDGSFTAEQLLLLARLFNVPVSRLAGDRGSDDSHADLQNALARLGAANLRESADVLPSERLDDVSRVVKEALVDGAPRIVVAVAPVIVHQIDRIRLPRIDVELRALGLDRRLPWVAENLLAAIDSERTVALTREVAALYRRASTLLEQYLEAATQRIDATRIGPALIDVLDGTIRSKRSLEQTVEKGSNISRRWSIATGLTPSDFAKALEAARAGAA